MAAENFSAGESLQVIQSMIEKTRKHISGQSVYFLLWGWCAFAACIGQYVLRILQFKPLLAGGIINWIIAIVAVWFSLEYQSLFAALALLFSYIIPGHLIRRAESASSIN